MCLDSPLGTSCLLPHPFLQFPRGLPQPRFASRTFQFSHPIFHQPLLILNLSTNHPPATHPSSISCPSLTLSLSHPTHLTLCPSTTHIFIFIPFCISLSKYFSLHLTLSLSQYLSLSLSFYSYTPLSIPLSIIIILGCTPNLPHKPPNSLSLSLSPR